MPRERLPDRRRSWTRKVKLEGTTYFMTCGEYPDGRPGEIFVDTRKEGTFVRGIMGTLARIISVALQNGVPVEEITRSLRGMNFPPHGQVSGSDAVQAATSVPDWMAQELEAAYLKPKS